MKVKKGRLAPPVALLRKAVRASLADLSPGSLVLIACSGGPDSLALAGATAFAARKLDLRFGLVTVDHQLQQGSDVRAKELAGWAVDQDFDPVEIQTVEVGTSGGPEAAARDARYLALSTMAQKHEADAILLGHTRDDQAETVLLALSRGAGPKGLAGMPAINGLYRRPLLNVSRSDTVDACTHMDLHPWDDPHNIDGRYARSRLRSAMRTLTDTLGEGLVDNLARSASLISADNNYLEELASEAIDRAIIVPFGLSVTVAQELPESLRTRVIHRWLREIGVPGGALNHRHVVAVDAMIMDWKGQGAAALPGKVFIKRKGQHLHATFADY